MWTEKSLLLVHQIDTEPGCSFWTTWFAVVLFSDIVVLVVVVVPVFFVFILILILIYYTLWHIFCFRNKLDEDINDILSDTHMDDELSVKVSLEMEHW